MPRSLSFYYVAHHKHRFSAKARLAIQIILIALIAAVVWLDRGI